MLSSEVGNSNFGFALLVLQRRMLSAAFWFAEIRFRFSRDFESMKVFSEALNRVVKLTSGKERRKMLIYEL